MGGADGRSSSIGHNWQLGGRKAPTVLNAVFNKAQFWDGRAADLKEQAGGPIVNPVEMGITKQHAVEQLQGIPGYVEAFKKAFPGEADPIVYDNIGKAIAVFEATLITPDAPFDRWLKGDDKALTEEQKQGLKIFVDKGCSTCHNGINIGGGMYARFGVVQKPGWEYLPPDDRGRFAVTKTVSDDYVFKVPTLRNVELTAPYFHSGHAWDLKQAVAVMGEFSLARSSVRARSTRSRSSSNRSRAASRRSSFPFSRQVSLPRPARSRNGGISGKASRRRPACQLNGNRGCRRETPAHRRRPPAAVIAAEERRSDPIDRIEDAVAIAPIPGPSGTAWRRSE